MVPTLRRLLPDKVDFYMEPFFGSGVVLLSRHPAKCEIVNDIDGRIVNFFRVLRERPEELVEVLRLTPWARDEWEACKEPSDDSLEAARRWYALAWQSATYTDCTPSWLCAGSPTAWTVAVNFCVKNRDVAQGCATACGRGNRKQGRGRIYQQGWGKGWSHKFPPVP